ncbi:hypothetical protein FRC03_004611 [Tulasnella sp. 419]|nr:hypothetical protein FRC03_004611 [Tulasnella sp. 419]
MSKASFAPATKKSQKELEGLSFITMQDRSPETRFIFASDSCQDILGWTPEEIIGQSAFDLIANDEVESAKEVYYDAVSADKAATVGILRFKHKEGHPVLCQASWSVVSNCIISSICLATDARRNMLQSATAQDFLIISAAAIEQFGQRQWARSARLRDTTVPIRPPGAVPFASLPEPSERQALVLNRFSIYSPILFCATNNFLDAEMARGRSFYDFVTPDDEGHVRDWINKVKGGGREGGVKSDGAFGYGAFVLCIRGRDSSIRQRKKSLGSRDVAGVPESSGPGPIRRRSSKGSLHGDTPRGNLESGEIAFSQPISTATKKARERRGSFGRASAGEIAVDAIFSAHSDGIIVVMRRASL